jgi:hypothetical protein
VRGPWRTSDRNSLIGAGLFVRFRLAWQLFFLQAIVAATGIVRRKVSMAKTSRNAPGNKGRPSSRKTNATGYAKRQSLKAKTLAGLSDVYEYAPDSKTRRSKVTLEIGRDEAAEIGLGRGGGESDDEAMDGEDMRMKARLIGEGDVIDSEDDEDIDSDAAFEESDEERFGGFSFNHQVCRSNFDAFFHFLCISSSILE